MSLGPATRVRPGGEVTVARPEIAAPSQSAGLQRPAVAVAWIPPEGIDRAAWISAGTRLGGYSRSSNWWVGDWLRYGTSRWGEKYVVAAKITGYDPHSLENMVYVASRFDISLRRENLSWSHHFLVAGLGPEEQTHWLDVATERHLSVNDLRIELRTARRGTKAAPETVVDSAEVNEATVIANTVIVCPNCGHQIIPLSESDSKEPTLQGPAGPTEENPIGGMA